jgi:hypothetical protein
MRRKPAAIRRIRSFGAQPAEPGERRPWGGAACEVYGALVERLTAKALRQMQHWTDIQVVSEPRGDFRSVRDIYLSIDSARLSIAYLSIGSLDNTRTERTVEQIGKGHARVLR